MALPIGPSEWIILDTTIVRGLISGEADAIDLDVLAVVRGKHAIALADAAPAEIIDWLLNRAPEEMLARVRPALEKLSPLLDPEFPIAPGGESLSAFAGIAPYRDGSNRRDLSRFNKAFRSAKRDIDGHVRERAVRCEAVHPTRDVDFLCLCERSVRCS